MVNSSLVCAPLLRLGQKLKRRKSLKEDVMETSLQRCLSILDLTLLGVGGMVGSGLYVLAGTIARDTAGPAILVSFLTAAIASLMAAFCYSEFGARVPRVGSGYMCTYVAVGEIWAFIIGWGMILEYMAASAAMARSWSSYMDSMFNNSIQNFTKTYICHWDVPFLASYPDFLAAGVLVLVTCFVCLGVHVSIWLNNILSSLNVVVTTFVIVFGFMVADPAARSQDEGGVLPLRLSGIVAATAGCFYTFVGFDVIATSSGEAKDPQRSVPIANIICLALVGTLSILLSAMLTRRVAWNIPGPDSAISDALLRRGYGWFGYLVAFGSFCAMTTTLLSTVFALPRIVYAMADDGLLFSIFSRVNKTTKVPVIASISFGCPMVLLAVIFDVEMLVQFLSIGTLLAYTFVAASVIVLRFQPHRTSAGTSLPSSTSTDPQPRPMPNPPPAGEMKAYVFSDDLQLVEVEMKEQPVPGKLKAGWERYLGRSLGNCRPGRVVKYSVLALMVSAVCLCAVLVFGSDLQLLPLWAFALLLLVFGLAFFLSLGLIWAHEPQGQFKNFQVPLVPIIPGVSILANVILIFNHSSFTFLRFAIWLVIGLVLYFSYGIRHSKEGLQDPPAQEQSVLPTGGLGESAHAGIKVS
ncbi:cationic amino acid transporter 4-like [Megalops cyprinoides]|uniref:cationic amino acid transporter 4-like n=1 Tax=Megalops cyprinoides TaxID=118141 RepID=UPI0018656716|nr:cationic amino acid transporter 4-like [Megalops cyprinoides]